MRFVSRQMAACAFAGMALALMAPATASAVDPPVPALPAVEPIPVKVIVVANFEPGEGTGDAPGEFQLWAEREKWPTYRDTIPPAPAPRPSMLQTIGRPDD